MRSASRHVYFQAVVGLILLLAFARCPAAVAHGAAADELHNLQFESHHTNSVSYEQEDTVSVNGAERGISRLAVDASPALLVIDVQNCFLPGGAIPVAGGNDIIPIINKIRESYYFRAIIYSKDWHCENHISFVTEHPNTDGPVELFYVNETKSTPKLCNTPGSGIFPQVVTCPNIETDPSLYIALNQTLWPPHCVQNTNGANLAAELDLDLGADYILKKGTTCSIDSYSAFEDNGGLTHTPLDSYLKEMQIDTVFVVGLTLDYCVKYSAVDSKKRGYNTFVILDAAKPAKAEHIPDVIRTLNEKGIHTINSADLSSIGLHAQSSKYFSLIFAIPLALSAVIVIVLLIKFLQAPPAVDPAEDSATTTDTDRKPLLLD